MEYFSVNIVEIPEVVFVEHNANGEVRFTDQYGTTIENLVQEPLHYIYRNFVVVRESWMEPAITLPTIERLLSVVDFWNRFTTEERIAIRAARTANPYVEDFLDLLSVAAPTGIYLSHPTTTAGVRFAEQYGLIAPGRADEILGA